MEHLFPIRELNRHLIQDFILNGLMSIIAFTILPSRSGERVFHQAPIGAEKSRFGNEPDHTAKADQHKPTVDLLLWSGSRKP